MIHPKIIIEQLLKRGLTQNVIATLADTSQPTICRVLRSKVQPRWHLAQNLNRVYFELTQTDKGGPDQ